MERLPVVRIFFSACSGSRWYAPSSLSALATAYAMMQHTILKVLLHWPVASCCEILIPGRSLIRIDVRHDCRPSMNLELRSKHATMRRSRAGWTTTARRQDLAFYCSQARSFEAPQGHREPRHFHRCDRQVRYDTETPLASGPGSICAAMTERCNASKTGSCFAQAVTPTEAVRRCRMQVVLESYLDRDWLASSPVLRLDGGFRTVWVVLLAPLEGL
jgi:hypothetical protein